jgi:hypothetical protein
MAPRMVDMVVMKTGRVPKVAVVLWEWKFAMFGQEETAKFTKKFL